MFGLSYSMSWPGSGPPEHEVPMSALCNPSTKHSLIPGEQHYMGDNSTFQAPQCRNPLPSSGSRRDSCGCWSLGSQGHQHGLCQGPCKDLRSGRGCTYRTKCKKCHFPHPEISSTSLRSKKNKFKAEEVQERLGYAQEHGCYGNGSGHGHSSTPEVTDPAQWYVGCTYFC
eukprot:TRINITY_DN6815_c1_g3_i1.p1 TRINITY_DN6815_c1_g3~~TRINITY_DN6815_c1_g3_i1.p1  ORF type:complete len:170 (+),score=12.01 TRINITY_DN6815_c1_g3_i1:127-636(+)